MEDQLQAHRKIEGYRASEVLAAFELQKEKENKLELALETWHYRVAYIKALIQREIRYTCRHSRPSERKIVLMPMVESELGGEENYQYRKDLLAYLVDVDIQIWQDNGAIPKAPGTAKNKARVNDRDAFTFPSTSKNLYDKRRLAWQRAINKLSNVKKNKKTHKPKQESINRIIPPKPKIGSKAMANYTAWKLLFDETSLCLQEGELLNSSFRHPRRVSDDTTLTEAHLENGRSWVSSNTAATTTGI